MHGHFQFNHKLSIQLKYPRQSILLFKFYLSTGLALSPWKFVSLRLYFGLGPYLLDSVLLSKQVNTNINIDPIQ